MGHAEHGRGRGNPDLLLGQEVRPPLHVWDLRRRRHLQALDLGDEHQMVLELRPAHDPTRAHGFVGVVVSVADLSASIWTWYREGERWAIRKTITIPAVPADPDKLPPAAQRLQGGAAADHRHQPVAGR